MKIVINTNGGFGISEKAIVELIKRNSKILKTIELPSEGQLRDNWIKCQTEICKFVDRFDVCLEDKFYVSSHDKIDCVLYQDVVYLNYFTEVKFRSDKDLVEVVEKLGKEAR